MKTLAFGAVLAATVLVVRAGPSTDPQAPITSQAHAAPTAVVARTVPVASTAHAAPTPSEAHAIPVATLTEVVQQYCVVCHNDALMTGNVSFQSLDVEHAADRAETVERMIRKLRAGMMPPPEIGRAHV